MSRTSAALVQCLLGGPGSPSLTPLESSKQAPYPMNLFIASQRSFELSGILTNRTGIVVRLKPTAHAHSWTLMGQSAGNFSFSCECSAFCAVSYSEPLVPFEALVPDRHEAANVLKQYLTNVLNNDTRVVQITERTASRLSLEILAQFGWQYHETFWAPPEDPDESLYMAAIDELDYVLASKERQPQDCTPQLFEFFGVPYSPYVQSPAQKLLGCANSDSEETVYSQYLNQVQLDPNNTPYYFDALQQMASQSEFLQMRFMEQESLGVVSLSHIKSAYTDLGLDIDDMVDEDTLIGIFDRDPRRLSRSLSIVATHRDSQRLRRLAAAVTMSCSDSMRILGIDDFSTEDLIASRARMLHSSPDVVVRYEGQYSLLQIASNRKSAPLLALYESLYPSEPVLRDPYDYFGIGPTLDDDNIVAAFEVIAQDEAPERQLELRTHLRAIAEARSSDRLLDYLETGLLGQDSNAALMPVGLWNIGNTCYLNSLLQFYYTVVPFRNALANLDAQKDDDTIPKKKVGGRLVPFAEVARSQKFLTALASLFDEMEHTDDRFVAPSEELAYMALVPPREDVGEADQVPLEHAHSNKSADMEVEPEPNISEDLPVEVENELHEEPHSIDPEPHEDPVDLALEVMDTSSDEKPLNATGKSEDMMVKPTELASEIPSEPVSVLAHPTPDEDAEAKYKQKLHQALERQQDVTECIENVLYQVEAGVNANGYDEDGEQQDLVKDLFYGNIVQTLANDDSSDTRVKHERVSSIMVNVADGPQHIHTALEAYFAAEKMELSEGVFERTVGLSHMPPILQIQVQRVQFNRKTYELFKNNNPLILDQTVYMDRYLQTDDPIILEKRRQRAELQERKKILEAKLDLYRASGYNGCNREDNLAKCAEWLECYLKDNEDEDGSVAEALADMEKVVARIKEETHETEAELARIADTLEDQFSAYRNHGYRLHSLFIHRGQASHGHYWIYIKDFERDQFLKYNDETVTVAPESEVFDYTPGNTATPYFIVYIREDFIENVKSINRVAQRDGGAVVTTHEHIDEPICTAHSDLQDPFADGMSIDHPIDLSSHSPSPRTSHPIPPQESGADQKIEEQLA